MVTTTRKALLFILASSLLAGIGQLLWKKASFSLELSLLSLLNWFFILGTLAYVLATLMMVLAFRGGELSVLHPFLATSYVWVTLISPVFIVGETLGLYKIIGVFVIFTGVSLIAVGGKRK